MESRLWWVSIVALALFVLLGVFVATTPLSRVDVVAGQTRGSFTQLALVFTQSGRSLAITVLAVVMIGVAVVWRLPVWVPIAIIVSQTVSQGVIELFKRLFHRPRPDDWLLFRDMGFSYPSGHASTAIVFYGAYLSIVLLSPLPRPAKILIAVAILVWMIGIDWSRLALGAHYFTDVVGGTLFGIFWLAAIVAALLHFRVKIAL